MNEDKQKWATELLNKPDSPTKAPTPTKAQPVVLDPPPDQEPDTDRGSKKVLFVVIAVAVIIGAGIVALLVAGGDDQPAQAPPEVAPIHAVPAAPTSTASADQPQLIPYTASCACRVPPGGSGPQALADTSSDSAWVCVRGDASSERDGQVLSVDFRKAYFVSAVAVMPGWVAKTPGGKDEWLAHRVVKRLQYNFYNGNELAGITTQDTGNTHGTVTKQLDHPLMASRVVVIIQETARPPSDPTSATSTTDEPETTTPAAPGEPTDPIDYTFAVAAMNFYGHTPN